MSWGLIDLGREWRRVGKVEQWTILLCVLLCFAMSQAWVSPFFGYGEMTKEGALIRAIWYPVYGLVIILLGLGFQNTLSALWRSPLLVALLALTMISAVWSIDPSTTIRRSVAVIVTSLFGYALAARFSWARLLEVLGLVFVILMGLSLFMVIVFPSLGKMTELFPGAWRGLWPEKNNFGSLMAIAFTVFVGAGLENKSRRGLWWLLALVAAAFVLFSTSKTALMSLIIALGLITYLSLTKRGPVIAIGLTWVAIVSMTLLVIFIFIEPEIFFKLLGKDATFTGRTQIWEAIARLMQERPMTGYGYGVLWSLEGPWAPIARIVKWISFRPYHAHSTWYSVWLDLGRIGLWLWAACFIEAWLKGFWRALKGDGSYFALPFLAILALTSMSESIALVWNDIRWVLFCMTVAKLSLPHDRNVID